MSAALVALILASLADVYTSHVGFRKGATEANPILSKMFGRKPSIAALLAIKAALVAGCYYADYAPATWAAAALTAAAALHNWRILRKL